MQHDWFSHSPRDVGIRPKVWTLKIDSACSTLWSVSPGGSMKKQPAEAQTVTAAGDSQILPQAGIMTRRKKVWLHAMKKGDSSPHYDDTISSPRPPDSRAVPPQQGVSLNRGRWCIGQTVISLWQMFGRHVQRKQSGHRHMSHWRLVSHNIDEWSNYQLPYIEHPGSTQMFW